MDSSTSDGHSFDEKLFDPTMLSTSRYLEEIRSFRRIIRKSTNFDLQECKEFGVTEVSKENLESRIMAAKLEGILRRTSEQITITGCWSLFLRNNSEILKTYLQSKDFGVVKDGLAQMKLGTKINPTEILEILMQNRPLLNFVAENKSKIHGVASDLIEALEIFKEHTLFELQESARTKIEIQEKHKASLQGRQSRRLALKLLQEQFAKQEEEYKAKIDALNALIVEYKAKVDNKRREINLHIKNLVFTSEEEMKKQSALSEANQIELEEAACLADQKYKDLLRSNLEAEKIIREERRRKEANLQSLIQKYDFEAFAKQTQIDELEEEMQNNQMELDEWDCLVFEQARVYKSYQREKENERLVELAKKLQGFQRNRAAIIIQRTWREYKAKKAARKKARKDKKKSKGKPK